jgi:hypothetical protein
MTFVQLLRIAVVTPAVGVACVVMAADPQDNWSRFGRDIDSNTFTVGHPASPRWAAPAHVHANGEHPAVIIARRAAQGQVALDPNTYIVQPPASVTWLAHSDAPEAVTVAGR